jgi:hypothetical protein
MRRPDAEIARIASAPFVRRSSSVSIAPVVSCIKLTNSENVLRTNGSYVVYAQSDQGLRMTRACDELYLDRVSTVDLDDGADVAFL